MERRTRTRFALLLAVILATTAVAAILTSRASTPTERSVTGVIAGVQSEGLDRVRSFSLRADDGTVLEFGLDRLRNAVEFPPGHLAEHQATGQRVRVTFLQLGESRAAVRLEDAP
jgi:hypothetical protein